MNDSEFYKLSDQYKRLREGITNITLAWAEIENSMVILLSKILKNDPSASMASTLYFSANSLDGRIALVDAAFRFMAKGVAQPEDTELLSLWDSLHNRIRRLKKTRNAVAHGQIVTVARGSVNQARLTSPMFDFNRHTSAIAAGQYPGMSANDIEASIAAANAMRKCIQQFWSIAEIIAADDVPTLRNKLAELNKSASKKPIS